MSAASFASPPFVPPRDAATLPAGLAGAGLSPAEIRVLALLREGHSNKEIAHALGRSPSTIKHQVSGCLRKFGQPSRARLIAALR